MKFKFKIGDRVGINNETWNQFGRIGTVEKVYSSCPVPGYSDLKGNFYLVRFTDNEAFNYGEHGLLLMDAEQEKR